MRSFRALASVLLLMTVSGCMGRGASVATVSTSNASAVGGNALRDVCFVPFDTSKVAMEGDHGDASTARENRRKWFTHVVLGAEKKLRKAGGSAILVKDGADSYDKLVMGKEEVSFRVSPKMPAGSLVVTGRYVSSKNVGGGSRFWLGAMSGKSWNRAEVTVKKGNTVVFKGTVDGKYLGGGYSWGYETLAVNQGLGAGIVEILQKLQKGERVSGK